MISSEDWSGVPSHPGYEVSSLGRVRSYVSRGPRRNPLRDEPVMLIPFKLKSGYLQVSLRGVKHCVHRLVLLAFVGPCPPDHEASHVNGDKGDNRLSNLRWETHIQNILRCFGHGTMRRSPRPARYGVGHLRGQWRRHAKLTAVSVACMRVVYATGAFGQRQLARWFDVAPSTVHNILTRKKWTHVENSHGLKRQEVP